MRTNPFQDTIEFLTASAPDQAALGPWRWVMMALFAALFLGSLLVAAREWAADPAQRTGRDLGLWAVRLLIGCMWFQNLFWKMPLFSTENGLYFWTGEEVKAAAFQFHRDFIRDVILPTPQFLFVDVLVFLTELAFAVSLMLGLGVRLVGCVAVLFVAQLWLGLYQNAQEWPWTYVFLACLMGLFALLGAGRSLGLDAGFRRTHPPDLTDGAAGALVRVAT